jgi:acyl-CoA synthetase (NDP forming)
MTAKVSIKNKIKRQPKESFRFVVEPDAAKLLETYHIPYPAHGLARDWKEAMSIAERIGFPVVLKIVSPDVIHKSDIGGVLVGIKDAQQIRQGFSQIADELHKRKSDARFEGVLICKQSASGLEAIIGAVDDTTFGPTIMFGLGGIFAETLKDVSFRIAPLERWDAEEMIREIKGYPLLAGVRGQEAKDKTALTGLLLSVSRMVTERPDIKQLDLNPVRLYKKGLMVLDVRLMLKAGKPGNE